jgi:hypothetical protein
MIGGDVRRTGNIVLVRYGRDKKRSRSVVLIPIEQSNPIPSKHAVGAAT